MAAISITVSDTTGLFSISIDDDWDHINVIDGNSPEESRTSGSFYSQHQPQMLWFRLFNNTGVQIVNQGQIMVLAGKSTNYMCAITYAPAGLSQYITLTGVCQAVGQNFTPTGSSQILFTQPFMSGSFLITT